MYKVPNINKKSIAPERKVEILEAPADWLKKWELKKALS